MSLEPSILLVEDEADIAEMVVKFIQAAGFNVTHFSTGVGVAEFVQQHRPDLVLLDLMLPGKDGLTCCKEIRAFSEVPIIMVTAKTEEVDRLIGLEIGADDYVCKPFSAPELVMRIKAIFRRIQPKSAPAKQLLLDHERFTVSYGDVSEQLTAVEFNLLALLHSQPGRIYSRQQIMDLVYKDYRVISDRTVDSHIRNLRKKLKCLNMPAEPVCSVYSVGYKYEPAVS
ncbi:response regulator [Corallincola spongiicola]|uniref:Response regulator n=1 Tax=Corallincola spongiicola TaxID=2520508 RepID=A0ABY1WTP1_9GAMM|nr:response regulator [Corallincola spongiicola]